MLLAERLDALLKFLAVFQDPVFSVGTTVIPPAVDGMVAMPYVRESEAMRDFVRAVYDAGWCVQFDWGEWQDEAQRYASSPELVARADVEVLTKLLTTHVRRDRFCEGHLAAMAESGHLRAILERMAVLRSELQDG